ncbi:MAG: hypothetical protein HYR64_01750 [Fimbriimonas ginsengisoli]|uniref:HEAT repeat domain-containing protein n=1 Tax=Fimbriimonas ginsengisoli TaxID=1005039 RepID=A0A931LZ16_FIMGI|nr:hypothetical protein [Fimbriimonas ginsengisoli]
MERSVEWVSAILARDGTRREYALQELEDGYEKHPSRAGRRQLRLAARALVVDPAWPARMLATELLGRHGLLADVAAIRLSAADRCWPVRASAYSALADLAGKREMRSILRGFNDRNAIVRRYAYVALGDAVGREAIESLRARLGVERSPLARVGLFAALAELGEVDAKQALSTLAQSSNRRISSPAIATLAEIDEERSA